MISYFNTFISDEDGAVTVDFVVLTAAIVLLALTVAPFIIKGTTATATNIEDALTELEINTTSLTLN